MIEIFSSTKIYVMCPPQTATGGPELLHQLVNKLCLMGYDAYMYYYPAKENPVHPNYLKYNCGYATTIDDNKENLLVIPEALLFFTDNFKQIRKCIWWLSIDNLFKDYMAPKGYHIIKKLGWESLYRALIMTGKVKGKFDYHLAQSHYAIDFLAKRGITATYCSDYLNADFLADSRSVDTRVKQPQVLYNPKKGIAFTEKVIAALPGVKWIKLIGLTPSQVGDLLRTSMVYIDFGEHPGKDRFPREAAIYKCCVITGRKGSAAYAGDVPIPEQYKIEDKEESIPAISRLIEACIAGYTEREPDFASYRDMIYNEEKRFEEDLKSIFIKARG